MKILLSLTSFSTVEINNLELKKNEQSLAILFESNKIEEKININQIIWLILISMKDFN